MIPRNVALIVHFHLTHLLPLSTSIFLLPPPNPHFYWYQRTQETSRQVWYQPNFCRSKKLYKPPESKLYEGLTVVSLRDFQYRCELWCLEGSGVCHRTSYTQASKSARREPEWALISIPESPDCAGHCRPHQYQHWNMAWPWSLRSTLAEFSMACTPHQGEQLGADHSGKIRDYFCLVL